MELTAIRNEPKRTIFASGGLGLLQFYTIECRREKQKKSWFRRVTKGLERGSRYVMVSLSNISVFLSLESREILLVLMFVFANSIDSFYSTLHIT